MSMNINIAPLVEYAYFMLIGMMVLLLLVAMVYGRTRAFLVRSVFFVVFAALLLNPVVQNEVRKSIPRKLLVVVDESHSMSIAKRESLVEKALEDIQNQFTNVEPIVLRASGQLEGNSKGTNLFAALKRSMVTLPVRQIAGTVLITDGQVHDVPESLKGLEEFAPFNVVLPGRRQEFDRKVTVVQAPKYGIVEDEVTMVVKVEDVGRMVKDTVQLHVMQDGKPEGIYTLNIGEEMEFVFPLTHVGQNVFEFLVEELEGEVTTVNNRNAVIVNAVRDRMKVLLVSGVPHMGERAWRNLLKSDPAIDLIHFTILRSPMSFDPTPSNEMSLIAFPVDELFQEKIDDFDLIIFDKYVHYRLLNQRYFANIASFVKGGGGLLVALNSSRIEPFLFRTDLVDVLPVESDPLRHEVDSSSYVPSVTAVGGKHPVTSEVKTSADSMEWHGQIKLQATSGKTLMHGGSDNPLLIIDEVNDGRVAVLTSDNVWLWSKSFETSEMYTKLLRNVAHWLMKEPELEDGFVKAVRQGERIVVSQRTVEEQERVLTVQTPDGEEKVLEATHVDKGWAHYDTAVEQNGLYTFYNAKGRGFLSVGVKDSKEILDVTATQEALLPLVNSSNGEIVWYREGDALAPHDVHIHRKAVYSVSNIETRHLLPEWALLAILFLSVLYVWRRESS